MFCSKDSAALISILVLLHKSLASQNITEFLNIRQKRSLIYQAGSIKFSVSGIWPLYLEDPVKWRQVNCLASLQTQFDLPARPLNSLTSIWGFPYRQSLRSMSENFNEFENVKTDFFRMFLYTALEEFMNKNGRNGRECMLRSICENAQIIEHADEFSQILDVILTPGKDDLDDVYREAVKAAEFGADCKSLYFKCLHGDSFLDRIAIVT